MLCVRTHFKASHYALLGFMSADVYTPSDQDRQSISESVFPHDRLFKPSEHRGCCVSLDVYVWVFYAFHATFSISSVGEEVVLDFELSGVHSALMS